MKHSESSFTGLDGFNIFCQSRLPEGEPRAVLLVAHGYAEHSSRYGNLVEHFVPKGYAIHALDHRGHGRSDGERVQVGNFEDYVTDLKTFFDLIRAQHAAEKIFLVGHSMGAAIAVVHAALHQEGLEGVVFSGGGIALPDDPPPPPRPSGQKLAAALSRDPAVAEAYVNDPLVYTGPPPERRFALAGMREKMPERAEIISVPVLIMAGGSSPLGEGPRSKNLYETVSSTDKELKLSPELLHEIFNEPEHPQVFADLEAWLEPRL